MVNRRAVVLAVGTAVTWGLAGTLIRLVSVFPAVFVTGLRLAIATVAVLPVIYLWRSRLSLSDLRRPSTYALAALLVAYYLTAVFAFQMAPVAECALLIASSPLLVLGANVLRGITISRGERFGALLACIGVAFVLGPRLSPGSFQIRYLAGELLALLSAACSASFATLFGRPRPDGSKSPDPLMVALTTFIAGGAALNAAAFAFLPFDLSLLRSPRVFVPALALGIISTAFPSLAYSTAARSLPPVLTTTIQLLIPVVSTVAAAIVLRELPSLWFIPGGILVLGGIAILVRSAQSPSLLREEEFTNL